MTIISGGERFSYFQKMNLQRLYEIVGHRIEAFNISVNGKRSVEVSPPAPQIRQDLAFLNKDTTGRLAM